MRTKCQSIATFHRPIHSHWSLPLSETMSIHLGYHGNQVHLDPQRYVPGIIRDQTRTVIGVT
jgi:hypothetical protein